MKRLLSLIFLLSAPLLTALETKTFKSHYLNNERTVWIYTPIDYKAERLSHKGYPLLLVIDGEDYMNGPLAPTKLDDWIAQNELQPLVVCYVGKESDEELKCDATFSRFIGHELTPWIRQHWNVTSHPSKTVVAGQGWAGLAAPFLALKNPTIFGKILSESGTYSWGPADKDAPEWLTKQYSKCAKLPLQFYLSTTTTSAIQLEAFSNFKETLEKKGYSLLCKEQSADQPIQEALTFLVGKSRPKPAITDIN